MDRRDSLRTLLVGAIGGAALGTSGCQNEPQTPENKAPETENGLYARPPKRHGTPG